MSMTVLALNTRVQVTAELELLLVPVPANPPLAGPP